MSQRSKLRVTRLLTAATILTASALTVGTAVDTAYGQLGRSLKPNDLFVGVGNQSSSNGNNYDEEGLWHVDINSGTRTKVVDSSGWTDRVQSIGITPDLQLIIAKGHNSWHPSNPGSKVYKVDPATGSQQHLFTFNTNDADLPSGHTQGDYHQVTAFQTDFDSGYVYFTTSEPYHYSSQPGGHLWRAHADTGYQREYITSFDDAQWERKPTDFVIDSSSQKIYMSGSGYNSSYSGYFWEVDIADGPGFGDFTQISTQNYQDRYHGLELGPDGTLWAMRTNYDSSENYEIGTINKTTGSFTQKGSTYSYDDRGDIALDASGETAYQVNMQFKSYESAPGEMWKWDLASGDRTEFHRDNDGSTDMFSQSYMNAGDITMVPFLTLMTGFNDVEIGTTHVNMNSASGPHFYSTDFGAEANKTSLQAALGSGDMSLRTGIGGDESGFGDITASAAIDYDTVGEKTMTLRAANNIDIQATSGIADSTPDAGDILHLNLVADNQGAGQVDGGRVDIDAAISLQGGDLSASGKVFDSTAAIATSGDVDLDFTGDVSVGETIDDGAGGAVNAFNSAGAAFTNSAAIKSASDVTLDHTGDVSVEAEIDAPALTSRGAAFTNTATLDYAGAFTLEHDGAVAIDAAVTATEIASSGDGSLASSAAIESTSGGVTMTHGAAGQSITLGADLTSAADASFTTKTLDTTASNVTVAGNLHVDTDVVATLGNVTAASLTMSDSDLVVQNTGGTYTVDVDQAIIASGDTGSSITIGQGGVLDTETITQRAGLITMAGGELKATTLDFIAGGENGAFNFLGGKVALKGDATILSGNANSYVLNGDSTVTTGQTFEVAGNTNVVTELKVDGGTFSTGSLSTLTPVSLNMTKGEVNINEQDLNVSAAGSDNPFGDTLVVNSGVFMNVNVGSTSAGMVTVASDGQIELRGGQLVAEGGVTNNGMVLLSDSASRLGAGTGAFLTNNSVISGTGRLVGSVNNSAGAELRAEDGAAMHVSGELGNLGDVVFLNGGSVEFDSAVQNLANARIMGSDGRLRFHGDLTIAGDQGTGSDEGGKLIFSGGVNEVFGDIHQEGTGAKTVVGGGSKVNFYGDFENWDSNTGSPGGEAELHVGGGAAAFFYGDLKGSGKMTGAGLTQVYGTFDPGQSPGAVSIEGDLALAQSSTLLVELAGTEAGVSHDLVSVGGDLTLDGGTLAIELIDGYMPVGGESFTLLEWGSLAGDFGGYDLPEVQGMAFSVGTVGNSLVLNVSPVPEPGTLGLLAMGLLAVAGLGRRRRANG